MRISTLAAPTYPKSRFTIWRGFRMDSSLPLLASASSAPPNHLPDGSGWAGQGGAGGESLVNSNGREGTPL